MKYLVRTLDGQDVGELEPCQSLTLGRVQLADKVPADQLATVSRQQAEILMDNAGAVRLHSRGLNPTIVEHKDHGNVLESGQTQELYPGDRIRFGPIRLELVQSPSKEQRQLQQLLQLSVNREAGAGLDVEALVKRNRQLEAAAEEAERERDDARVRVRTLEEKLREAEQSEVGGLLQERDALRQRVAELEAEVLIKGNLLESLQMMEPPQKKLKQKATKQKKRGGRAEAVRTSRKKKIEAAEEEKEEEKMDVADEEVERDALFLELNMRGRMTGTRGLEPGPIAGEWRSIRRGQYRIRVGDAVYLASEGRVPFIGKVERLYEDEDADDDEEDEEGPSLKADIRWYFRYVDLPADVRQEDASSLSRERELWLSNTRDTNPVDTIIGRLLVRDVRKVMNRHEMDSYVGASPHNFFERARYDDDEEELHSMSS